MSIAAYERAVEACLGELLEHVIVERHDQAAAGLSLVRQHDAGRCGFVVVDPGSNGSSPARSAAHARHRGRCPMCCACGGPHAITSRRSSPRPTSRTRSSRRVALASDMPRRLPRSTATSSAARTWSPAVRRSNRAAFSPPARDQGARERVASDREQLVRLAADVAQLEPTIAEATGAITGLQAEEHAQEKAIVAYEAQLRSSRRGHARLARKAKSSRSRRRTC